MRIDSSDKRLIATALLVILAAGFYVWWNYEAAFPQASLELKLTRDQITSRAESYLQSRRIPTQGFRNFTIFEPDEEGRLYLERELGLARANQLMHSEVPIWKWRARWYKPPEKEEMLVYLKPDGKLTGFEHRIRETDEGRRLETIAARLLAEAFLKGLTDKPHRLVAEQTEKRPNRDDHVFTWEQEGFKAKEATIRRTIVIHGDRVGSYQEFLYIPEQWRRDFAKLRSSNELYAGIANGFYALLAIAAVFAFGSSLRKREIAWKPLLAIAASVAVVNLLNELNTVPFAVDNMPSSAPYMQSLTLAILQAIGSAAGIYLYVLGPLVAGVAMYHRAFPNFLRLPVAFTRAGIGTRSFFRATVAGFGMAGGHLAFLTAFYLIGAKFGVWSPQDVSYSDMLATPLPWVYPIAIAMMASSAEEFWFRLLAIPLLGRVLKVRLLAIVIPAFVWGFLHANYPQQPGYIRGVEVGLIGVAAGFMMYRFGIVATLTWHYVIDAFLIGLFLFRGGNWLYVLNSAITILLILAPLIAIAVLYRKNDGFLPEPDHSAEPAPVVHEVEPEPVLPPVQPPMPARYLYLSATVVAAVLLLVRPYQFGGFISIGTDRTAAETAAAAFLQKKGIQTEQWRVVSDFTANLRTPEIEYLRQQTGRAGADALMEKHLITGVWRVRFFQPLNPEEWLVYIDRHGHLYRYDHVLDEKAGGAKLTPAEARQKAEDSLKQSPLFQDALGQLADSQEDKRDNRTDHSFEWEDASVRAGDAKLRTSVTLIGDEVCENRRYFKLPEQWLRDYQKPRLASYVFPAFVGAIAVPLVIAFVRRLSAVSHRFHWKAYAKVAALMTLSSLLDIWNSIPTLLRGYDTSTALENYYGQLAVSLGSSILFSIAGVSLAALAADAFLQLATGLRALPKPDLRRTMAAALLIAGMGVIPAWIRDFMPGPRLDLRLWDLPSADAAMPAVDILLSGVTSALLAVCVGAIVVLGAMSMLTRRGLQIVIGGLLVMQVLQQTLTPVQTPFTLAGAVISLALLSILVLSCATDLVSIGLAVFWVSTLPKAWRLYQQSSDFLHQQGILLVVLVVVISLLVYSYGRKKLCEPLQS